MKSLPEINYLPINEIDLMVLGKKVKFVPFTVEQEKSILMGLESENINDMVNNYVATIKACLRDEIDWENFSLVDFVNLIVTLRAKSKGESLSLRRDKCKNEDCEQPFEFETAVEKVIKYRNVGNVKSTLKINDHLTFELKPLDHGFLYGLNELEDEMDLYKHTAAHCVSKFIYNKEIYKVEDSEEFKTKVVKNLTSGDLKRIFEACKDFVTIYLEVEFECPHCGHVERVNVENFLALLKQSEPIPQS